MLTEKLYLLVIVALGSITIGCSATCSLTSEEWSRIKESLSHRNYYHSFVEAGDCNQLDPQSLRTKYASCTKTLEQIVEDQGLEPSSNCYDALRSVVFSGEVDGQAQEPDDIHTMTSTICRRTQFRHIVSNDESKGGHFCFPLKVVGCPRGSDILKFITYGDCMVSKLANKSREFVENYFETGKDVSCLRKLGICVIFEDWYSCPITVNETLTYLSTDGTYTCDNVYPFHPDRCSESFATSQMKQWCVWNVICAG